MPIEIKEVYFKVRETPVGDDNGTADALVFKGDRIDPAAHSGGVLAGMGDGSVRDISPQATDTDSSTTQTNPPWGLDRIDQSAPGGGGGTGKVSVHDISISKQHVVGVDNVELTIKVLDAGAPVYGAMSNVEYTLTVTDTETGHAVTERESGLVYSGESGGMNDGAYLTVKLPDVLVTSWQTSAADAAGPMKESMETMKKASTEAGPGDARSGTHEVGHWIDPTTPSAAVSERDGGLIYSGESGGLNEASVPQFSGGVVVAAGDSAAPAEVPPVQDISVSQQSGHEGAFYLKLQGVDGDIGASLPPQRQATLTMFSADHVGSDDAAFMDGVPVASDAGPNGRIYLGTDHGVFEHHVSGIGGSWGLDRIDQHDLPGGHGLAIDMHFDLFV